MSKDYMDENPEESEELKINQDEKKLEKTGKSEKDAVKEPEEQQDNIGNNKEQKRKKIMIPLFALIVIALFFCFFYVRPRVLSDGASDRKEESSVAQNVTTSETEEQNITTTENVSDTETTSSEGNDNEKETTKNSSSSGTTSSSGNSANDSKPLVTQPEQTSANFAYTFTKTNSWQSGNMNNYQFQLTVKNNSSADIKAWSITATVPAGTKIQNSWNCKCSISGTTLKVSPVDYNSYLSKNSSRDDIGFIFESSSKMDTFSGSGVTSDINNSGNSGNGAGSSNQNGGQNTNNPTQNATQNSTEVPYTPPKKESGTPLANHGKLTLKGSDIVDKNGNKYQLKGVSTHGIAWFPEYVNKEAFKTIRDDWGGNVIRLAMYTAEYNGYCSGGNQSELEKTIDDGVKYATELGMYVIIDWHILSDSNPNTNKASAEAFFTKMSTRYKNYDNVIYEICNEPNGGTNWNTIKSYADDIISIIRKQDKDAIIVVGTPTWSQDVDAVVGNPVKQPYNVMYTLHFYAATHKDDIRNKLKTAKSNGIPIFITEFSICDASGAGGIDSDSAKEWKKLINSYNISYCAWSLCNKSETSALIKSGCSKTSGWTTSELSDTGIWVRNMIAGK